MRRSFLLAAAPAGAILLAAACSRGGGGGGTPTAGAASDVPAAVPVQAAPVTLTSLDVIVTGPGRTDVTAEQHVRAPFQGILSGFTVVPGDRVGTGQTLGSIVSQLSAAALSGARAMLAAASTPSERADAERAVRLAAQSVVRTPIRAPRGGIVVSRPVSAGDLVAPGDSLVTIAPVGSLVFIAQLAQNDAVRVRPGQPATVALAGTAPITGTVRRALPADSAGGLTVPVRIALDQARAPLTIGLFGTAHIVVSRRANVTTVPVPALLRDDINGITRIAVITPQGKAHWVTVTPGITQNGLVEIVSPALAAGTRVITMGQVGLPEGSRVQIQRMVTASGTDSAAASPTGAP